MSYTRCAVLAVVAGTLGCVAPMTLAQDNPATGVNPANPTGAGSSLDISISAIAATTAGGKSITVYAPGGTAAALPAGSFAIAATTVSCNVLNTNTGTYNADGTITNQPPPQWYEAWDTVLPNFTGGIPAPQPNPTTPTTVLWGARHPYIINNTYRINADGRLEQLAAGWVKHGWFAASSTQNAVAGGNGQPRCGVSPFTCNTGVNNDRLGANCSDTYGSTLNAAREWLGPRTEVNPRGAWSAPGWDMRDCWFTRYTYNTTTDTQQVLPNPGSPTITPRYARSVSGSTVSFSGTGTSQAWKLNTVTVAEIDSSATGLGTSGRFFIEGHYAVNGDMYKFNNTASRRFNYNATADGNAAVVSSTDITFNGPHLFGPALLQWNSTSINWGGVTGAAPPGTFAFATATPADEGLLYVASRVVDLGGGLYRYEYNVWNQDMDREVNSLAIPVPASATITNVGFWQPRQTQPGYHGYPLPTTVGGTFDGITQNALTNTPGDPTRWTSTYSAGSQTLTFAPPTPPAGQLPNTIRWGTMYTFWFTANAAPNTTTSLTFTARKPGTNASFTAGNLGGPIFPPAFSPADIAGTDGSPGSDGNLDNGDFSLFFTTFFAADCSATCGVLPLVKCNEADIADTASNAGFDGCVDNGDFSLFFSLFFAG